MADALLTVTSSRSLRMLFRNEGNEMTVGRRGRCRQRFGQPSIEHGRYPCFRKAIYSPKRCDPDQIRDQSSFRLDSKPVPKRSLFRGFRFEAPFRQQRIKGSLIIQYTGNSVLLTQGMDTESQIRFFPADHDIRHKRSKGGFQKGEIRYKMPAYDTFRIAFAFCLGQTPLFSDSISRRFQD